jgi:hypothetical protein
MQPFCPSKLSRFSSSTQPSCHVILLGELCAIATPLGEITSLLNLQTSLEEEEEA